MTDALHISNLSASIEGRAVLRDVSLVVGEGERHVLTGASGSGKTLLGRAVLRLLPAGGSYEAGAIRLGETDLLSLSESDMRRVRGEGVAMVPQLAMAGLHPQRRLLSLLAERLRQRRQLSAREAREEGLRLLARVGVADPEAFARKWPHQLSGGMRQRVAVALALADAPRVLIADEPTSGLDAASRHWVMAALDQERRERGMALLLITHDLDLVGPSEMTSVMEDARVRESGRFDALDLLVRGSSRAAVALGAEEGTVLQVEGLTVDHVVRKGFTHTVHRACSDVSFSVRPREIVALVGPSGAGKSSVLGAIAAQIPHAGRVRLDGAPLARTIAGAGRGVQLAAQDASGTLDPRMSLGESLAEALNGTSPSAKPVSEWLALVGLDPALLHRLPSEVSAGQRQRVVVARALCRGPRVLLLDEPTSGLDAISANALVRLLTDIRDRVGFACVVASHDMRIVNALADRVLTLEGGRLVHTQGDGPT